MNKQDAEQIRDGYISDMGDISQLDKTIFCPLFGGTCHRKCPCWKAPGIWLGAGSPGGGNYSAYKSYCYNPMLIWEEDR